MKAPASASGPRLAALPGLAALAPVVFYAAVIRGAQAQWASALVAAGAVLALSWSGPESLNPQTLGLSALSCAFSCLVLLPLFGAGRTAAAACLWLALGLRRSARGGRAKPDAAIDPWLCAFGAAAFVPWTRCLTLLSGNSVLSMTLLLSATAATLGLVLWWRRHWLDGRGAIGVDEAAIAAASLGLVMPHFFRFLGLNSGFPSQLYAPLRCFSDAVFLAVQPAIAISVLALPAALAAGAAPTPASSAAAAAGPLAAAWLLTQVEPARAATLVNSLMLAYGFLRRGLSRPPRMTAGFKLLAGGALAAAALGWTAGDPFVETWLNRLNAAYPGGRFLAMRDRAPEALGAYQFSTGLKLLLRDGVADPNGGVAAWRETHLALLTRTSPRDILLVGARQPAAWEAASRYGARVDIVDSAPEAPDVARALAGAEWKASPDVRFVSRPGASYDAILLYVPVPTHGPEAAALTSVDSLRDWRGRLKPGGLLALCVPQSYFATAPPRIVRAARDSFTWFGVFRLPGTLLLLGSEAPIGGGSRTLEQHRPQSVLKDDPGLDDFLHEVEWRDRKEDFEDNATPDSRDRSRNALPFWEILTSPPPNA